MKWLIWFHLSLHVAYLFPFWTDATSSPLFNASEIFGYSQEPRLLKLIYPLISYE